MLKKDLRLNYLHLRKTIPPKALDSASIAISNQVLSLPIWSFSYFHIFLQIPGKAEIDTNYLLSVLQGKDKNVVVPMVSGERTMKHYLLTDNTTFKTSRWNIPEPVDGLEVPAAMIDVVFVPLLAYDKKGHRVGYGKGFYDVFLKGCKANVVKIGLSLFEAEEKISDVEESDIPLDYCVTPERIYEF